MSYCHRCGKFLKDAENFCSSCGAKTDNIIEDFKEETEEILEKTSNKGVVIFILFLLIVGYAILDIWAIPITRPFSSKPIQSTPPSPEPPTCHQNSPFFLFLR